MIGHKTAKNKETEGYQKMPKKKLKKSPVVQQQVIAKALTGDSQRKIAEDLHIHRKTVKNILVENNVEEALEQWRNEYRKLIPNALEVTRRYLETAAAEGSLISKREFDAAQDIFRGTGIHEERTRTREDLHIHDEYKGRSRAEIEAELAERLRSSQPERAN